MIMCTHYDHFMKLYISPLFYIMQLETVLSQASAAEKTESAVLNISGPLCCMYAHKSMLLLGFFDFQSCHSLTMSLEC